MKLLYWLILLTSLSANARVITESFTSLTNRESSTLIWNFALGQLHPNLQIFSYGAAASTSQAAVSVSDGSHGAFEPSTYTQFGTVVGNHITIDASLFPVLKVSSFHLDSTHTLSSINGPLVIHSLSTVTIDGVIECHGANGGNAAGVNGGAGGAGRCGGFPGGAGGNATNSGADGLPATGLATGGGGGFYTSPVSGAGGGGGAGYLGFDGQAGFNSANPAANLGGSFGVSSNNIDHNFINLNGSAGGGGGCGSGTQGGAGGGAGGGTVVIHAVSSVVISNTGAILANGGNGGVANNGGGGGGGGGGNIKIFTPATFEVASGSTLTVGEGLGSIPGVDAGAGGDGGPGRAWIMGGTNLFFGSINGTSSLAFEGTVGFVSGTAEVATSKSFDTGSSLVTYQSVAADITNSDITFQVAGSDDNFVADDSGWINAAAISGIAKKRYVKYRVSINNSDPVNPTILNDVFITFDPGLQENFAFKSGGCGLVKNAPTNLTQILGLMLLLLPLIAAWRFRKPKTVRVRVRK